MYNLFNIILKFALLSVRSRELTSYAKVLRKVSPHVKNYINDILTNPEKVSRRLLTLNRQGRKELALEVNEALIDNGEKVDFAFVNSSWIISGVFEKIVVGSAGNLTLTLKNGRSYTYYGVPQAVWDNMKQGTHAGTKFWALYLRGGHSSVSYQKVALAFKLAGIRR